MTGRLSTHVLDVVSGRPAAGMRVELRVLDGPGGARPPVVVTTNADGRTDRPLLEGPAFVPGRYELTFHVGRYFAAARADDAQPAFLDDVPVRFVVAAADRSYHVPLLVSPWSYTTYRGS